MFGTTTQRTTITEREARRLATAVEMISQDYLAPVEVSPRIQGNDVTRFAITPVLTTTHAKSGPDLPTVAHSIAQELAVWSNRLKLASDAIRERYPMTTDPAA